MNRPTLITGALFVGVIVAAVVVRALVLGGFGWLSIPTISAAALIPGVALLVAFGAGFIVRGKAR